MADRFSRDLLKLSIAQTCQTIGWNGIQASSLDLLADLTKRYMCELGRLTHRYSEQFGRTEVNFDDLGLAFRDLGVNLQELGDYVQNVEPYPLSHNIPKYPVRRDAQLNFLKPGSHEVVTRPVHIHEHLPPMQPSSDDEEKPSELAVVENGDAMDSSPGVNAETPPPGSQRQGVFKRPSEVGDVPNKRSRVALQEEGQPLREITSVMMTTSGYLSSSREGKLPEARLPHPLVEIEPSNKIIPEEKRVTMKKLIEGIKKADESTKKKDKEKEKDEDKEKEKEKEKEKDKEKPKRKEKEKDEEGKTKIKKKKELKEPKETNEEKVKEKIHHTLPFSLIPESKITSEPDKQKLNFFKRIPKIKEDRPEPPALPPPPPPSSSHDDIEEGELGASPPATPRTPELPSPVATVARKEPKKEKKPRAPKIPKQKTPKLDFATVDSISPSKKKRGRPPKTQESPVAVHEEPERPARTPETTPVVPPPVLQPPKQMFPFVPPFSVMGAGLIPNLPNNLFQNVPFNLLAMAAPGLRQMGPLGMGLAGSAHPAMPNLPMPSPLFMQQAKAEMANKATPVSTPAPAPLPAPTPPPAPAPAAPKRAASPVAIVDSLGGARAEEPSVPKEPGPVPAPEDSLVRKKEKKEKKDKEKKKKDKKQKERERDEEHDRDKEKREKKEKKKEKREKEREKERGLQRAAESEENAPVPKITFKFGAAPSASPRSETPDSQASKIIFKPVTKRDSEERPPSAVPSDVGRDSVVASPVPTPEVARFAALVTRPPKTPKTPSVKKDAGTPTIPGAPSPIPKVKKEKDKDKAKQRKSEGSSKEKEPKEKEKDKEKDKDKEKEKKKTEKAAVAVITETVGSYYNEVDYSTRSCFQQDEQGNKIWICPACGRQDDGTPMIGCDACDDWYHWVCVGIQVPPAETENWYCQRCIAKQKLGTLPDKKKGRKKKSL